MSNKVSIKDIKAAVKANKQDPIKFTFGSGENTIDVEFQPSLSLTDEILFVQRVVNGVFIGDEYHNEYKDIVFTNVLLDMMSNLSLPYMGTGNDKVTNLSILKDWDNALHFKNIIYKEGKPSSNSPENVNNFSDYVEHLEDMVEDKIEYIKEHNFNKSKLDELFDTVNEEVKKFSSKFDNIDIKQFAEDLHKISGMVGNVDTKTIIDEIVKANQKTDSKDKIVNIADVKQ